MAFDGHTVPPVSVEQGTSSIAAPVSPTYSPTEGWSYRGDDVPASSAWQVGYSAPEGWTYQDNEVPILRQPYHYATAGGRSQQGNGPYTSNIAAAYSTAEGWTQRNDGFLAADQPTGVVYPSNDSYISASQPANYSKSEGRIYEANEGYQQQQQPHQEYWSQQSGQLSADESIYTVNETPAPGQQHTQQDLQTSNDEIRSVDHATLAPPQQFNLQYLHLTADGSAQESEGPYARDTRVYDINAFRPPFQTTPYMPDYSEYLHGTPSGTPAAEPDRQEPIYPITIGRHPREDISPWKWRMLLVANNLLTMVNGYDVSNVANIQAPVYHAFGGIELLPWVGLSYSVCNIAMIPLARKLFHFYDFKVLIVISMFFTMAGTALAGAAPNLNCLIAGRALMAVGASVIYQGILSFNVIFSYPHELAMAQASLEAFFAVGLILGPAIGGAFADSEHATWRWAFYFALPLCAIGLVLLIISFPKYRVPTTKSVTQFREIDWIGNFLHMGTFLLFGSASLFSGGNWPWNSGSAIAIWIVFSVVAIAYVVQQTFSIGTAPERRIFPCYLMGNRTVLLTFICTGCAAMVYGVTLYYTPIFYAFTHNRGPLEAAVRLLPFISVFIVMIFVAGGLLPVVRVYMPFYVAGAVFILVGGGLFHTIKPSTSESAVMGFSALIGGGVGIIWQLAIPLCSVVLQEPEERLDQAALHNMAQLGGTAIALSIAGAVYQNVGLQLLKDAVGFMGFSDHEIRELLAGVYSPILAGGNPAVLALVVDAVTETIVRCFYLLIAAGAVCFVAACCLRIEALRFVKRGATRVVVVDLEGHTELNVMK
ncbi:Uu.00g099030.m01.CDS01 [Anthostomella pinea]|uniref:Uu.00g099030.m01.CDS01 n=1 Tax=Anthostomella pinea TaxID=933095 RepID=A0AAI8VCK8_9PEZI|nr:Uu.00g099030.m01.CDS01 [Anthostomella pinea]